ncbi:hydroxyacid dehydrogenase [Terrilactibacillus sp. BCM23-1]|uniref:Hydroxyacid dehydrogenase n=1 Tax=Terrilactibacillus tamarindi TaxID=2599694 RepID=A0A6N8CP69_9BACI|nr:2-hydroxyacid dehydrogenase family protein [Terrilactibacillus tamarindi]MTT31959.1 hydroxyacid dehydrogenase [Terrilactibacillus tamarindi]
MAKIFIAGRVPKLALDLLHTHEVTMFDDHASLISEEELVSGIQEADALLCPLSTKVSDKVISQSSKLKIIANYGAGYDNIDIQSAKAHQIYVSNTPGVSTDATAELTMGLILSIMRRMPEGDRLCRGKGFNGWAPLFFLGSELKGKTLGIIGLGSIGQAVAKRAKAFDMNIIYYGPHRKSPEVEKMASANYVSLEECLKESDVISIHAPYSPSIHHLINQDTLKMMKKTAYLINAARGPIVDEKALAVALKEHTIAGAALDVFEFEPSITEELKSLDNVVITPHIGNATIETRNAMAEIAANNILSVLNGNEPVTPVQ